jgi:predicted DNA-binding transcriptional regulator YafY
MKLRADRLPVLLALLQEGNALLVFAIACRLDVSVRTVYRDLRCLRNEGHRIIGSAGTGGGVMLRRSR